MSLGFGFTFTLTVDLVIGAAPPERAGAASAIAETGAELGGALGLAVLGSLGIAVYRSQVAAALPPGISPEVAEAVQETLGGAVAVAMQLPDQLGLALLSTAHQAFVQGLQLNASIGVVGFAGLAILTMTMLRHVDTAAGPEQPPNREPDGLAEAGACIQ
jgi:DHA2 family multidrug resistance protein-like MFS transporter